MVTWHPGPDWSVSVTLHSAIASQETTGCLYRHMGRHQMTKDFRCLYILWVSLSDDFCKCTLNLFDLSDVLTAA